MNAQNRGKSHLDIEFGLTHPERVNIALYDLSGKKRAMVVNKHFGTGSHRYTWDTRLLAQGCYMVRFQAGAKVESKFIQKVR